MVLAAAIITVLLILPMQSLTHCPCTHTSALLLTWTTAATIIVGSSSSSNSRSTHPHLILVSLQREIVRTIECFHLLYKPATILNLPIFARTNDKIQLRIGQRVSFERQRDH